MRQRRGFAFARCALRGAGGEEGFDLYSDDGATYAYESGEMQMMHLKWSEKEQKLTHSGAALAGANEAALVKVMHAR